MKAFCVFTIYLASFLKECLCLREVELSIPEACVRGSSVEMKCSYDLEGQTLYSVKWYRGDREFSRYSPRDVPPLKVFPIRGIEVDRDRTDAQVLTIRNASSVAHGRYTCEVSADAPSFQTTQVFGHMYVVDIPSADPKIIGFKQRYKVGTKLKAECVSPNSNPAANLSFYINDEPALSQHIWHRVDTESPGLMTAYSTIQFTVQQKHFLRGKLKLRCTAIMYSIYRKSEELCALEAKKPPTPAPASYYDGYSVRRMPEKKQASPSRASAASRVHLRRIAIASLFISLRII